MTKIDMRYVDQEAFDEVAHELVDLGYTQADLDEIWRDFLDKTVPYDDTNIQGRIVPQAASIEVELYSAQVKGVTRYKVSGDKMSTTLRITRVRKALSYQANAYYAGGGGERVRQFRTRKDAIAHALAYLTVNGGGILEIHWNLSE